MFSCTKQIGIDAAHRVPTHGSKCKNVHGHRYEIHVTITSTDLIQYGEQSGMVMDFGFLKQLMMEFIDANCDHGIIVWVDDEPLMHTIFQITQDYEHVQKMVQKFGSFRASPTGGLCSSAFGKAYIVPFIPTAENLAKHWADLLAERVEMRSKGNARLQRVRVYETPSSNCDYPSF